MYRKIVLWLCLILIPFSTAMARDNKPPAKNVAKTEEQNQEAKSTEVKELSGMSVVGNDEAPKSLYIVPWKSSELGVETNLNMMLNANDAPVDRDVFMRQMDFYELSTKK